MFFLKLLLAFAPWLVFLVIAQGSLLRLKIGLGVSLILCVVMGLAKLHRGIILWTGVVFFLFTSAAVIVFENAWAIRHMGVLASSVLALSTWAGLAAGKPFTLDYAKEHADPKLWDDPAFIRGNMLVSTVWAVAFSVNVALAFGKMDRWLLPEWGYELLSYGLLCATASYTAWYSAQAQKARKARNP